MDLSTGAMFSSDFGDFGDFGGLGWSWVVLGDLGWSWGAVFSDLSTGGVFSKVEAGKVQELKSSKV